MERSDPKMGTTTPVSHTSEMEEGWRVLALTLSVGETPELHGADGALGMDGGLSAAG